MRVLTLIVAIVVLVAVVAGGASLVALRQARGMEPRPERLERAIEAAPDDAPLAPAVLRLIVVSARLVVTPTDAGRPLAVESEYDPRYYTLRQDVVELDDGRPMHRIRFAPAGNHVMAILRMKLGTALPIVRVELPRDAAVEIDGTVIAGFAAMELGGTAVHDLDVSVEGGAVTIGFIEPLAEPMGRLVLRGDKGSIELTGVGNASPAETIVRHRLGEVDLDLRGAWRRDASIRLDVSMAGGGVWLPRDVAIVGLPRAHTRGTGSLAPEHDELAQPRLTFEVSEGAGRLVFID